MRIMAQKNASPSAWTRQKEVIVGQPATAILVENAKKAKAEVKLIEAELADESVEGKWCNITIESRQSNHETNRY
jgi:hypothetical protein